MDVNLRIIGKGKRCLGHSCRYAWKVRIMGKNSLGLTNSKFRNAGYAWKVRIMCKIIWI